jgi:hypothetical protein
MFGLFGAEKTQTKQPSKEKQVASERAFQDMERRIAQIHYYYRNADLSPDVRQVMAYRKLLELDYFTPKAAQELMKQWQNGSGSPSKK